ncbi:hypothetical protein KKR91_01325 [Arthrobacter jiangjiafuii]|uniref:Uncharacterized protein n=1 Tax=Arthrobacter jiangjiafuii TaxID=2817475 RepID=A0A975QZW6_9MICC|nr:hypothetical protein [Arthrobacter jiangjiafuii]MBP3044851.1 hypothetical protein [Arthrobacter jiangjiafuii]QWC10325.1 hypothetical protein KKR91_01325 [Arthrobacter jiangjiafuii]
MSTPMALTDLDWSQDAVATILGLARAQSTFSADDLTRDMRKPPHPNMAGAAFSAARKLGYIEPTGFRLSTNPTRRHGVIRTWQATPLLAAIARRQQ